MNEKHIHFQDCICQSGDDCVNISHVTTTARNEGQYDDDADDDGDGVSVHVTQVCQCTLCKCQKRYMNSIK